MNALDPRIVSQSPQQRVGHTARARLDDAETTARLAARRFDPGTAVGVVVELDNDVGIADTVGEPIQLFVELGVLDLRGLLVGLGSLRFCRRPKCKDGEQNRKSGPSPSELLRNCLTLTLAHGVSYSNLSANVAQ